MNPELPAPQIPHESQPAPQEGERIFSPEQGKENAHEYEQSMRQADRQTSPPPPPPSTVPLPPPLPVTPLPAQPQSNTAGPTIAADDDLIEKEWVDKAKKIIAETKDDPYRREQEVARLQADYLRKRYGKELGVSN